MSEIELPAAPYLTDAICKAPWTVDDIVRSYGKACARAALERAAQIADNMPTDDPGGPWFNDDMSSAAYLIAAAIRAEIEKDEGK